MTAEILLPRGVRMARCQVVCQKCDKNGCQVGRSNNNPIFDIQLYEVKFPWRMKTELSANMIAQSTSSWCDSDRYECLLLEAFINCRKDGLALSVDNQMIESQQLVGTFVVNGKTDTYCGRSYWTLRNHISCRLPNILQSSAANMNQHLIGGFIMSYRNETALFPMKNGTILDT